MPRKIPPRTILTRLVKLLELWETGWLVRIECFSSMGQAKAVVLALTQHVVDLGPVLDPVLCGEHFSNCFVVKVGRRFDSDLD